jgi:hypothetical protein
MFERGRRLMLKQNQFLASLLDRVMRVARITHTRLKAHVDTPLHSPNEWILKGFHPIAMAGRIM